MFKTIVVPLDGSPAAEKVLTRIAPLRASGSTVHLVRVVQGSGAGQQTPLESLRLIEAESYLAFVASEVGSGARAEVRRGVIADEILAAATAAGADLIGLSPHGDNAPLHASIGSTAGRLILSAACPVFVVGTSTDAPMPGATWPRRVMVALDGSPASEAGLAPARQVARASGAVLTLVHVIEPLWAAGDSTAANQQVQEVRKTHERLRDLAKDLGREGITARPLIVRGDPANEIRAQVERRGTDLLCLSTASRGPLGRLVFGAVAQKLIGTLPVPVIAVRRSAPSA